MPDLNAEDIIFESFSSIKHLKAYLVSQFFRKAPTVPTDAVITWKSVELEANGAILDDAAAVPSQVTARLLRFSPAPNRAPVAKAPIRTPLASPMESDDSNPADLPDDKSVASSASSSLSSSISSLLTKRKVPEAKSSSTDEDIDRVVKKAATPIQEILEKSVLNVCTNLHRPFLELCRKNYEQAFLDLSKTPLKDRCAAMLSHASVNKAKKGSPDPAAWHQLCRAKLQKRLENTKDEIVRMHALGLKTYEEFESCGIGLRNLPNYLKINNGLAEAESKALSNYRSQSRNINDEEDLLSESKGKEEASDEDVQKPQKNARGKRFSADKDILHLFTWLCRTSCSRISCPGYSATEDFSLQG